MTLGAFMSCLLINRTLAIPTRNDELTRQYSLLKGNAGPNVESTAGCYWCKSSLSFMGKEAAKYAVGTQM